MLISEVHLIMVMARLKTAAMKVVASDEVNKHFNGVNVKWMFNIPKCP